MLRPLPLVACLLAAACIPGATAEPTPATDATATQNTQPDETAAILAVLREAEALGLPKIEAGATFWFEEEYADPRHTNWTHGEIHARQPDGRWVIGLLDECPANAIPTERATRFTALDHAALFAKAQDHYTTSGHPLLLLARCAAMGDPAAPSSLISQIKVRFSSRGEWLAFSYPRPLLSRHATPIDQFRESLVYVFQDKAARDSTQKNRWLEAALAMAPASIRTALAQHYARIQAAKNMPLRPITDDEPVVTDPWEALTRIDIQQYEDPPLNMVPGLSDDVLVGLIGDARTIPGLTGEALGDRALNFLACRWGFDPILMTTRDRTVPWDDAERAALAADLSIWWQRHRTDTPQQRLLAALAKAPWRDVALILGHRQNRNPYGYGRAPSHHRTAIVLPTFAELRSAALPLLAQRLRQAPLIDTDITSDELRALLGFLNNTPPHPDLVAALATWPRTGRLTEILTEWDDVHGEHAAYDALMTTWWTTKIPDQKSAPSRYTPFRVMDAEPPAYEAWRPDDLLIGWVQRPTPERWQQMRESLRRDIPTDSDLRFRFAIGTTFGRSPYDPVTGNTDLFRGCALPLLWLSLQDTRPLPAPLVAVLTRPHDPPPATDVRWCDAALDQMQRDWSWRQLPLSDSPSTKLIAKHLASPRDSLLALPLTLRDTLVRDVSTQLAPFARSVLDRHHLDVPPELAACTTATISEPGLLPDERDAIAATLKTAIDLGLPDPTGATVYQGPYRHAGSKDDIREAILRLPDGRWLTMSGIPLPAEAVTTAGEAITTLPPRDDNQYFYQERTPADLVRVNTNNTAPLTEYWQASEWNLLPALAWWRTAMDPNGRALTVALVESDRGPNEPINITDNNEYAEPVPTPSATLAAQFRHHCVRLFRYRAAWATDRSETVRWVEAIRALLLPDERAAWEPTCSLLIKRWDIPVRAPANADVATRLQSWDERHVDPRTGKRRDDSRCPVTRADTAALIALLDDERPSRWLDGDRIPRCLGDNALRALCEVWDNDWRLIACGDPAVAQALQAAPADWNNGNIPRTAPWTPECRRLVAASLRRWWQEPEHHQPCEVVAAMIPWMRMNWTWRHWLPNCRDLDERCADACAHVLRRLSPPEEWAFTNTVPRIALRFPRHAGLSDAIAAWPTSPARDALIAMRTAVAGGADTLDAWFAPCFTNPTAPDMRNRQQDLHPLRNLGLLTAAPTPARRDRVVALLTQPTDGPIIQALLPLLGHPYWPSVMKSPTTPAARLIPATVALAGLDDQRLSPAIDHRLLDGLDWDLRESLQRLASAEHLRLCDVTAAALINERRTWDLDPLPDGVDKDTTRFLRRSVAERDKTIAGLKDAMKDVLRETSEKAGWATPATTATEANRF